jgi:nucleolar protein 15
VLKDKYLLSGKQLVVKHLPSSKVHANLFKGSATKFKAFPLRSQHADRVNKVKSNNFPFTPQSTSVSLIFLVKAKSVEQQDAAFERLTKKERKKRKTLASVGIEYDFPGYSSSLMEVWQA